MKRTTLPAAILLALLLGACGGQAESPTATPISTPASTPTEEPTADPTASEPAATPGSTDDEGGSGIAGDLVDALPDEIGGQPIQVAEGLDQFILPALEQQGIDAEEADFAFASYGESSGGVAVTAMRMPGLEAAQLEMLASMLASAGGGASGGVEFESETVTVGGKEVLRMTGEGTPGHAYVYLVGDAFFTIVSESPELAEELLSQLP